MRPEDEAAQGDLLCENERDHVSDMDAITTRSPTGIQEKWLPLLVPIQDSIKLSRRVTSISRSSAENTCQERTDGKRTFLFARADVVCALLVSRIGLATQHRRGVSQIDQSTCRSRSRAAFRPQRRSPGRPMG